MKPPRWSAVEWDQATLELLRRDGSRCGWCGLSLGHDGARHHRTRRRDGGDRLANIVILHSACHSQVHAHPFDAKARGFIVPPSLDVLTVPVVVAGRGPFLLDDQGGKVAVTTPL